MIVSPHFPPVNAADMHRVRQNSPYLKELGWEAEVLTVHPKYVASPKDLLLEKSIPQDIPIHRVSAIPRKLSRRIGIGSIAIRAWWPLFWKGLQLLRKKPFDLVFFSTTAFHVIAAGPIWKRFTGVPFLVDMQDPWRSDFYLDKPKSERPPKFALAYAVDKYLEAFTLPKAAGIIAVSQAYCTTLKERYTSMQHTPCLELPFAAALFDAEILEQYPQENAFFAKNDGRIHTVYVGRGGYDMHFALTLFFKALKKLLTKDAMHPAHRVHCHFIGTSYAAQGEGEPTIAPLAEKMGLSNYVTEHTDRVPYFNALQLLQDAHLLLIPGSTDSGYTASKLYPYLMSRKPLLAIFNRASSVVEVMRDVGLEEQCITFDLEFETVEVQVDQLANQLDKFLDSDVPKVQHNDIPLKRYAAETMTKKQTIFFDQVLEAQNRDDF